MLEAGSPLGPYRFTGIDAPSMKLMADILDDPVQIHLDAEWVKHLGLGDKVINQGPSNIGYVQNMLLALAPGAFVERTTVRLLANVFDGEVVVAAGTVDAVTEEPGARRLECSVWLDVEGGARAVEGTAVVRIPA